MSQIKNKKIVDIDDNLLFSETGHNVLGKERNIMKESLLILKFNPWWIKKIQDQSKCNWKGITKLLRRDGNSRGTWFYRRLLNR